MRILVVGDTHLGKKPYNLTEKEKDIYEIFDYILEIAKNYDLVIFLGDLIETEKNTKIKIEVSQALLKLINSLNGKYLIIRGNHDNTELIKTLLEFSYPCKKFEEGWLLEGINNYSILGIHYTQENLLEILDFFHSLLDPSKTILCIHSNIKELLPFETAISLADLKPYHLILNGHLHNHYQINNYLGVGAIDIFKKDEIQDAKYVFELIIENEKIQISPIPLPIRPFTLLTSKKSLFNLLNLQTFKKPIVFYNPQTKEDTLTLSDMLFIEEKTLMFKIITENEDKTDFEKSKDQIKHLLNYANFQILETIDPKKIIIEICQQFEIPENILNKIEAYLNTKDKNVLKEVVYAIEEAGN